MIKSELHQSMKVMGVPLQLNSMQVFKLACPIFKALDFWILLTVKEFC